MDKNKTFDIPIVLFIFKRVDKTQLIIKRLSEIRPKKIYIIADGPRDISEAEVVNSCRQMVEESIDWECEIIKNYSRNNRGVYENIGEGAKWVFKKEEQAIFLEDDNLPNLSFFDFCKEMLIKYRSDDRILWVCGTNYLDEFENKENTSYVFTQHLLPCGWASWSDKFLKYYDGNLNKLDNDGVQKIKSTYKNRSLFIQQSQLMINEKKRIEKKLKPVSWDYQMEFSLRYNNLLGISPTKNLIENIGVDEHSIHGGTSFENIMTRRFCSMKSYEMKFPLVHPSEIKIDKVYEKKIGKIILHPFQDRVKRNISKFLRKLIRFEDDKPLLYKYRKK